MRFLLAAAALAVLAAPVVVPDTPAQAQGYTRDQGVTKKVKKAKTQKRVVRNGSRYSTNPEHDVYVNGVYVGSDPDPRIRWSLKKEWCEDAVDGC